MNVKTSDPDLIDIHVENCVDFHKKLTEFTKVLDDYPDEKVVSNLFHYCKYQTDSIYTEAQFFVDIHNDKLKIDENTHGAKTALENGNAAINKLYGSLNDNEFLVLDLAGNPQFRNDNKQVLVEVRQPPTSTGELQKGEQSWKDIEQFSEDMVQLQQTMGLKSLSTWFLIYWLDRYRKAHRKVKEKVEQDLGDSSIHYKKFSESIGSFKNVEFIKQVHTTPVTDFESENDIPYNWTGVINYVASDNEKRVGLALSKHTNKLFKQNLNMLTDDPHTTDAAEPELTDPHGINVIPDTEHYERMNQIKGDIHSTLQQELDDMYRVLLFISNNENSIKIPGIIYKKYVEGMMIDVDLMKVKAKKILTKSRNDALLRVS